MDRNEAEISTLTDGEGATTGIMVRFPDEAVTYDTPAEARDAANRIERALADQGVDDPSAEDFVQDIRARADEWEDDAR